MAAEVALQLTAMSYHLHSESLSRKSRSDLAETIKVTMHSDNSLRIYTVRHGYSGDVRIDGSQAAELIRKIRAELKRYELSEDRMDAADAAECDRLLNDPKQKPIPYAKARLMFGLGKKKRKP